MSYKTWLIVGAVSWLLVAGCGKSETESKLRDRIVAANTSQYCCMPDACFSPLVLAYEDGYDVTIFLGAKFQNAHVSANDLAKYLQELPVEAWPRGPLIEITVSCVISDEKAVQQNFEAARQMCQSMGLDVHVVPAG